MNKADSPVLLADSVYWLGSTNASDFLQINVYLVFRNGKALLIDPGPKDIFPQIRRALESLLPLEELSGIVLSNQNPDVCSSISLWEESGFRGNILAHWKNGVFINAYGLKNSVTSIKEVQAGIGNLPEHIRFYPFSLGHDAFLATFDESTGTLFSSVFFGAFGRSQNLFAQPAYANRMIYYHRNFMPSGREILPVLSQIEALTPRLICPHHGEIIEYGSGDLCLQLRNAVEDPSAGDGQTGGEDDREWDLEKFELNEELVLSSDEKLVDPVTGLYNSSFYFGYLPGFIEANPGGTIGYLRIDKMMAFNQAFGFQEGDRIIATFATILQDNKPDEAFLFRDSGPMLILMLPDSCTSNHLDIIESLQNSVRDSDAFIQDMTCSAAVVSVEEAREKEGEAAENVLALIRERLGILGSQGTHSMCNYSKSAEELVQKTKILIIDPGNIYTHLLVEYLTFRGMDAEICRNGTDALRQIDLLHPDLIICETQVPQMDGFRIREQLLRSWDLRNIPFVFISHLKTVESVKRAQDLGVFHNLKKPVMLSEVEGLILHLLGSRE